MRLRTDRTKLRPLASGEVTPTQAITFLGGQLSLGLAVLTQLNLYRCALLLVVLLSQSLTKMCKQHRSRRRLPLARRPLPAHETDNLLASIRPRSVPSCCLPLLPPSPLTSSTLPRTRLQLGRPPRFLRRPRTLRLARRSPSLRR
jgi:hypothetical protein